METPCNPLVEIVPASRQDIPTLAALASEIWHQHFPPIIGEAMVEHMIDKFQSPSAMLRQMESENYHYYFLKYEGQTVGYTAIQPGEDSLFLSKIYLRQSFRGRKISRSAIDFMVSFCKEHHLHKIWLTVNRDNLGPIAAYEKMGFRTVRTQKVPVGRGFYMDDFVMEKSCP